MAATADEELLQALRQKKAELEELQNAQQKLEQERQLESKLESVISKIDFSPISNSAMWSPPVFILWGFGYLSNMDVVMALVGLLVLMLVTTFASVYRLLKSEEAQKAAALAKPKVQVDERDANTKVRSSKKGPKKEAEKQPDESAASTTMSWKTWLVPFAILWVSRHNMTDFELLTCVAALIVTMLLGSRAVRAMESMEWRKKLRSAGEGGKSR